MISKLSASHQIADLVGYQNVTAVRSSDRGKTVQLVVRLNDGTFVTLAVEALSLDVPHLGLS